MEFRSVNGVLVVEDTIEEEVTAKMSSMSSDMATIVFRMHELVVPGSPITLEDKLRQRMTPIFYPYYSGMSVRNLSAYIDLFSAHLPMPGRLLQ